MLLLPLPPVFLRFLPCPSLCHSFCLHSAICQLVGLCLPLSLSPHRKTRRNPVARSCLGSPSSRGHPYIWVHPPGFQRSHTCIWYMYVRVCVCVYVCVCSLPKNYRDPTSGSICRDFRGWSRISLLVVSLLDSLRVLPWGLSGPHALLAFCNEIFIMQA